MTNAEKFEEVFGEKPDLEYYPIECSCFPCSSECKYFSTNDCERWWLEEYKNPYTITSQSTIGNLIADNSVSIIETCKYELPCGWCEKRDMLCTLRSTNCTNKS